MRGGGERLLPAFDQRRAVTALAQSEPMGTESAPCLLTGTSARLPGTRGLELVRADSGRPPEVVLRQMIASDHRPDAFSINDALGLRRLDDEYFAALPGIRGGILRRLPLIAAQLLEVLRLRSDVELVLSWSEAVVLPVALLMLLLRRRPAHIGVLLWISKPKKALPLGLVKGGVDRFLVPAPLQRRFALERLGLSAKQVPRLRWFVDTKFWRPGGQMGGMICCVGREMRDYATFIEAIRPLGISCHIAAGSVTTDADNPWLRSCPRDLPPGVTIGARAPDELRHLYEGSRFVVIPLLPSDTDNGITTALEAFAMGKAVICTDTPGQVGVLMNGVNCLRVPPGDVVALRRAIKKLWSDPELCTQLGTAGRDLVERRHGVDQWMQAISAAVNGAIADRRGSAPHKARASNMG